MTADMNTRPTSIQDRLPLEREARAREADERLSVQQPLSHYRDVAAWVLLADPGAGKSDVFHTLSLIEGGTCVSARDFSDLDLRADWQEPLFIDGLDEITAGSTSGITPLRLIRQKLQQLGTPKFRISCREADWRGNADAAALQYLVGKDNFAELHLAPLSHEQSAAMIAHWQPSTEAQARAFMQEAEKHDLGCLLDNPQTLRMLVKAHAANGGDWPASKTQIYEMACAQLVREHNDEHLANSRDSTPPDDKTLLAAGYLCAVMLLSGSGSIALQRRSQPCTGVVTLHELKSTDPAPDQPTCRAALHTRLFRGNGTGDFWPVHRTVAEHLGARYLASRIEAGLPASRVQALMTGEDGGIVPELRGLNAWLAATVPGELRRELIERDPLGVVLNGDVRNFSRADKLNVLNALRSEATRYTYFRSQNWASHPFGALATKDMEGDFKTLLLSADRCSPHFALLDCILDALAHGQHMSGLAPALDQVVRDKTYRPDLRIAALAVLVIYAQKDEKKSTLTQLLMDVRSNTVEDPDDELLGMLLQALYPSHISPAEVWHYFRKPKSEHLLGAYWEFWHDLPKTSTTRESVSALLDALVLNGYQLNNEYDPFDSAAIVGELLVYGVTQHGDQVEVPVLYRWLSLGLGPHHHCPLEVERKEAIGQWLEAYPALYKALFEHGLHMLENSSDSGVGKLWQLRVQLYEAQEPEDAEQWYLSLAQTTPDEELRRQLVFKAFRAAEQKVGPDAAIELLEKWSADHINDTAWIKESLQSAYPPPEYMQQNIDSKNKSKEQRAARSREIVEFFRQALPSFDPGPAHVGALGEVASVYLHTYRYSNKKKPEERLLELLNQNQAWARLALHGLRQCLFRDDLPSATDIVDLYNQGEHYTLSLPCLAAMELRYAEDPVTAVDLPVSVLETVVAFHLTNNTHKTPDWFKQLLAQHPEVLSSVMQRLINQSIAAKVEHIEGLSNLARDTSYAAVAKEIVPQLIADFPVKAREKQLKSLRLLIVSVMDHLARDSLLALIADKLNAKGMDVAQQVYWLIAGVLLAPDLYMERAQKFVAKTQVRASHMFALIQEGRGRDGLQAGLPAQTQAFLIGLLGPKSSPAEPRTGRVYMVTPAIETGRYVANLIEALAGNPDDTAMQALTDLQQCQDMKHWSDSLNRALYEQRIARRKALFKPASVEQVCKTLANLKPASAADLWALTVDHLKQLALEIRHGSTNDYRQYWAGDTPRVENDCRDTLMSDLKQRLSLIGVSAEREGSYADDKRADIKVISGDFHIPIEIKRESHPDVWKAIGSQLIAKYSRETASDGYAIYLVFWFTGDLKNEVPRDGGTRPKTPQDLQQRLTATVPEALRHKIAVLVVDCSKPVVSQVPR